MKIAYTILEVSRNENANLLRSQLVFLEELRTRVCNAMEEYPECVNYYPEYRHLYNELTSLGFIGLWVSTLHAFHELIESDYDSLLILEDDVKLVDNFESIFKQCLTELPDDWGMFSVGYRQGYAASYFPDTLYDKDNICRMFQTGDSWGILYKKEFVKHMLDDIKKYKILGGISDTAIVSYAYGNVGHDPIYKPYSVKPSVGSLLKHDNSLSVSSIQNSSLSTFHITQF